MKRLVFNRAQRCEPLDYLDGIVEESTVSQVIGSQRYRIDLVVDGQEYSFHEAPPFRVDKGEHVVIYLDRGATGLQVLDQSGEVLSQFTSNGLLEFVEESEILQYSR